MTAPDLPIEVPGMHVFWLIDVNQAFPGWEKWVKINLASPKHCAGKCIGCMNREQVHG